MPQVTLITPFPAETDSRAKRLSTALGQLGHQVTIISTASQTGGGRVTRRMRQYLRIASTVWKCPGHIIAVNSEIASIAVVLRKLSLTRQGAVIADIYDHHSYIFTGRLAKAFHAVENFAVKHSDAAIIPIKERLEQYVPRIVEAPSAKLAFVSNLGFPGSNSAEFLAPKSASAQMVLTYAGTIDQGRALPQLATFAATNPQATVRIFGSGPFLDQYLQDPAFARVYQGKFSAAELPSIYAESDVIYAPYETFVLNNRFCDPNKLRETYSFSRPMITNAGTPLANKVRSRDIGACVDELTPATIGAALEDIRNRLPILQKNIEASRPLLEREQQENLHELKQKVISFLV